MSPESTSPTTRSSESAPDKPCPNCGAQLTQNFCATCGQRSDVGKLSVRGLMARSLDALTSFEQPLWRTLRGVIVRPGRVASDYVEGRRVRYTNPIKFSLISTGLAFLTGRMIGSKGPVNVNLTPSDDMPEWARTILTFLESNAAPLFVLLLLPLLAMTMRLCFRGTGRSFAEELVVVLYAYGAAALLQVCYAGLAALGAPANLGGPLPLIWTAWAAVAFHKPRRAMSSVLLTILAHALWILVIGATGAVALLLNRLT